MTTTASVSRRSPNMGQKAGLDIMQLPLVKLYRFFLHISMRPCSTNGSIRQVYFGIPIICPASLNV